MSDRHVPSAQLPELTDCLRKNSRKVTGPRQAILNVLRQHPHPLSSKELFARLGKGDCNLATIYRSLHLLESIAMVKRFDFGDGVARYELVGAGNDAHHHHLVCRCCAEVVEIDECFPRQWEEQIARRSGFHAVTHTLEFFGVCAQCKTHSEKLQIPNSKPQLRKRAGQIPKSNPENFRGRRRRAATARRPLKFGF